MRNTLILLVVFAACLLFEANGFMLAPSLRRTSLIVSSAGKAPIANAKGGHHKDPKHNSNSAVPNRGTAPTWQKRPEVGSAQRTWRSGDVLVPKNLPDNPNGKRRNDPWWMRDDEKNNPRILPVHKPWWRESYEKVDSTWTIADLKAEAVRRGIAVRGLKNKILAQLVEQEHRYSLMDDNFTPPVFIPLSGTERNSCYPDVYESGVPVQ